MKECANRNIQVRDFKYKLMGGFDNVPNDKLARTVDTVTSLRDTAPSSSLAIARGAAIAGALHLLLPCSLRALKPPAGNESFMSVRRAKAKPA